MVVGRRAIKLAAILIPDSVSAVFTTRYNNVITWVPITTKYDSIMSLPCKRFVSWESWDDGQVLVTSIQERIVFRAPNDSINRLASLNNS
jgi:hypothetical protein